MKLDNPLVVQWEYASEERLATRNSTYRELSEGVNPEDEVFAAVREASPARFLDVGCGMGELAERVQRELGASVCAVDISPRMVELTRARGVDAVVADVQELPFEDAAFDCVAASWVLDHVPAGLSFGYGNGEAALAPHFGKIERREANGTVVFPSHSSMHEFVAATTTRSHLADRIPELAEPFATRSTHCVFVAEKAP